VYDPTIIGPYSVLDLLGEGGAGTVYLARKGDAGPLVALKAVHVAVDASQKDQAQVRREIFAMERLRHPNVVRLLDAGYDGEWLYYAMEHCERGTLDRVLEEQSRPNLAAAIELAMGATRGIEHLHQHQIIHRDLKPANILMTNESVPKICDLGVARLPGDPVTPEGVRIGTPRYMAPEVRAGQEATETSDIFQLGLILYRLVTGIEFHKAHKTSGFTKGAVSANFMAQSRFNESATNEVDSLILDCLHPEPVGRPQNATELLARLQAVKVA
jgi:serine/threonine-protein kinase